MAARIRPRFYGNRISILAVIVVSRRRTCSRGVPSSRSTASSSLCVGYCRVECLQTKRTVRVGLHPKILQEKYVLKKNRKILRKNIIRRTLALSVSFSARIPIDIYPLPIFWIRH